MFLRNKKLDAQTISLYQKELKKLKRENENLRASVEELDEYKYEYKKLIEKLSDLKEIYSEKIRELNDIKENFSHDLERLK